MGMKNIKINLFGSELLFGWTSSSRTVCLIETENQLILKIEDYIMVSGFCPEEYVGLVEKLNEQLYEVAFVDWQMVDIVDDWDELGCKCENIKNLVTAYFNQRRMEKC